LHKCAANVGIVVIGRNEGQRLKRCLESSLRNQVNIIYVDSGSVDGSMALARSMGATVIELDASTPFSAARARNAGYRRLIDAVPDLDYVQFVDGDCELAVDWLATAIRQLENRPQLAIVAGCIHERFPEMSIYNRLAHLEWNIAGIGDVDAVGGIFMIRRDAFDAIGGFDPTVVVGEEPELCLRLRQRGWRIARLGQSMAWHDLGMTRFRQWWRRSARNGYGAQDVALRFGLPEYRRMTYRARFWSAWPFLAIFVAIIADMFLAPVSAGVLTLLVLGMWPAQLCRIAVRTWRNGEAFIVAAAYAFFTMISFWPQMAGQMRYWSNRWSERSVQLVEHKAN
jgi:GT2 family glycosyltransferase